MEIAVNDTHLDNVADRTHHGCCTEACGQCTGHCRHGCLIVRAAAPVRLQCSKRSEPAELPAIFHTPKALSRCYL